MAVAAARGRPSRHEAGARYRRARPRTASSGRSTLILGAPGSLVGDVRDLRTRGQGLPMTINGAPADASPVVSPSAPAVVSSAPPSWPWRRAALFLAGAAQLITISALVGADPIPATWSSLLLAVAPAPLAAVAAFAPAPVNLLAA